MSNKWAHSFFDSCSGQRLQDRLQQKADKNRPLPRLQIVFPTDATVRGSALGANGGGTIMFNRKHWDAFPQSLMRSCKSTQRPIGPLMHSKVCIPSCSLFKIVLFTNCR